MTKEADVTVDTAVDMDSVKEILERTNEKLEPLLEAGELEAAKTLVKEELSDFLVDIYIRDVNDFLAYRRDMDARNATNTPEEAVEGDTDTLEGEEVGEYQGDEKPSQGQPRAL